MSVLTLKSAVLVLAILQLVTLSYVVKQPKIKSTNTTVYHTDASIPGPIGPTGMSGANGLPGVNGTNGVTATYVSYLPGIKGDTGNTGPAGPQGEAGNNGATYTMRKDPVTGDIQGKSSDDDFWTTLITKCDYTEGCNGS